MPAGALTLDDPLLSVSCTLASGNLVKNCGFETPTSSGVVAGWTHLVSHASGEANVGSSSAHSGNNVLVLSSTTGDDVWTQTVPVAPHTKYLVSAWVFATDGGGTTADDLTIAGTNIGTAAGGTTIYTSHNTNLAWTQVGDTITTGSGHSMTLILSGQNVPAHNAIDDIVVVPQPASCTAIANNRVANCGFENSSAAPWTLTAAASHSDTQIPSASGSHSGNDVMRIAAFGGQDDTWRQVLSVRPHTAYTLTYWVEYWSGTSTPNNDLHVSVTNVPASSGGTLRISSLNVGNKFWSMVTKTFVTGSGSTATLRIGGQNTPSETFVDDVSVTAVPHVKITHSGRVVTVTLNGVGGQKVYLEKLVGSHWVVTHTWVAPKTGYTKSWALTVGSGGAYRALSAAAPGYGASVSGAIAIR